MYNTCKLNSIVISINIRSNLYISLKLDFKKVWYIGNIYLYIYINVTHGSYHLKKLKA